MWLTHIIERNWTRSPERIALRDLRRDVTWAVLERDVAALAAVLHEHVPPGGRVAVLSGNRIEVLETYLACARAGVIAAPINPALTDTEITVILDSLRPSIVVAEAAGRERLYAGHPELPVLAIEDVPDLPAAAEPHRPPAGLTTPVAILHTSATTGLPKGVVVDERSLQLNAMSWLADVGAGDTTVFLNACPLFHGSMVIALDYLAAGGTVCVMDRFTPHACVSAIERWQIDQAFLVPSMVQLLLESRALDDADMSTLRLLLHGAAPMPAALADAATARLGVRLQTIYGITEGGGPTISLRPDDKPGNPPVPGATCAGRPMLGTQARIVGPTGASLPRGEIGEIHLAGDGLMQGYWQNPAATAEVLSDGWLNTRDLGCLDEDGYIWIVDRRNDLILRGGQNVYPAEIEHVLRRSPQVADVAVVPAPSAAWGQTPVAFVQPVEPGAVSESELLRLCVEHLASYKRPSRFVLVDKIPRNPAGKVLRAPLRQQAEREGEATTPPADPTTDREAGNHDRN
jgi:acyl-CoA synthetase (AMP-forming)/AMP-acid ligase II